MSVVVCLLTCATPVRRSELLNGLWVCGVRQYPDIGTFWDKYTNSLKAQYDVWGKTTVLSYVTGLIRRYKPEVIATHDVDGEYGHGAHRVCADACLQCVKQAADPGKYKASASTWGVWQPKKLYIHMYKQNQIEFDWDAPLTCFDHLTGYAVAENAYAKHASQTGKGYKVNGKRIPFIVEPRDSQYSCYLFGLAYTAVGPDINKNDPFENIDPSTLTNWKEEQ